MTITACESGGQPAEQQLPINLVGDLITADYGNKRVESFTSDGTDIGTFINATTLGGEPTALARLNSSQILVGVVEAVGAKTAQVYDFHGNHQFDLDEATDAGKGLWQIGDEPWDALQDSTGTLWVTRIPADSTTNGSLYQFSSTGTYLGTVPAPADFAKYQEPWAPQKLALLPDGSIVASVGSINEPFIALFPPGAKSSTMALKPEICVEDSSTIGYSCKANPDEISYGALYSMLFENGMLTIGTFNGGGDYMFATMTPDFSFLFSTDTPTDDGNIVGIPNMEFVGLEQVGAELIASQGNRPGGCLTAISPSTLSPDPAYTGGCWNKHGASDELLGIVRLR